MKQKKVKQIVKKIEKVWTKRYPNQKKRLKTRLRQLEQVLKLSPYNDGFMRVSLVENKETHLVPFEEIILNGLRGSELHKYPIEGETK